MENVNKEHFLPGEKGNAGTKQFGHPEDACLFRLEAQS